MARLVINKVLMHLVIRQYAILGLKNLHLVKILKPLRIASKVRFNVLFGRAESALPLLRIKESSSKIREIRRYRTKYKIHTVALS